MASIDERKQALDSMMGVSPQNSVEGGEGGGEVDYYQNLRNESYKAMLDSEIQANAAKEQSLKYVNNSLNAAGYGNQGMAESTRLGLFNAYQNAMGQAQTTYNNAMTNIGLQEAEAEKQASKDNFESMTALMGSASSKESLDKVLSNYGITSTDGVLSGEGYNKLDDESKKQLSSIYELYSSSFNNGTGLYNSLSALQGASAIGASSGKPVNLGTQFGEEIEIAYIHAAQGDLNAGDVVKLDNSSLKKNGDIAYIMWTGSGFKVVNQSEYEKAGSEHQHSATWKSGSETIWK